MRRETIVFLLKYVFEFFVLSLELYFAASIFVFLSWFYKSESPSFISHANFYFMITMKIIALEKKNFNH